MRSMCTRQANGCIQMQPYSGSSLTSSAGLKTPHFGMVVNELTLRPHIHSECRSYDCLDFIGLKFTGKLNEGATVSQQEGVPHLRPLQESAMWW
ncbi:hypothetical protein EDB89DRAFT_750429 [Lactarius sanguifluus]|nr:hypothetical protein EDB89DRAFT_750429 [Lactarius sanguifluus]